MLSWCVYIASLVNTICISSSNSTNYNHTIRARGEVDMPCKHRQYTATRLSGPFVFARPHKYDTPDLIQAIRDGLNPSGYEFKVLQEEILHRIKSHQDQTFLRKMDNDIHERLSLKSLDLTFPRFNGYFFKNTLTQDTKMVREITMT